MDILSKLFVKNVHGDKKIENSYRQYLQTSGYKEKMNKKSKSSSPGNTSSGVISCNHEDMDFNTLMVMKKTNSVIPRVSVDVLGQK